MVATVRSALVCDVFVDDLAEIHAVELVAAEDEEMVEIVVRKWMRFLRTASAVPWYQEASERFARRRGFRRSHR